MRFSGDSRGCCTYRYVCNCLGRDQLPRAQTRHVPRDRVSRGVCRNLSTRFYRIFSNPVPRRPLTLPGIIPWAGFQAGVDRNAFNFHIKFYKVTYGATGSLHGTIQRYIENLANIWKQTEVDIAFTSREFRSTVC